MSSQSIEPIALFVFIPFCKIKCTYCDFNVYANLSRVMEPYANAVAREIEAWRRNFIPSHAAAKNLQDSSGTLPHSLRSGSSSFAQDDSAPLLAKSIYLGGGTPSMVPTAQIEKTLRACHETFSILPNAEVTLEANPGTMDASKLRDLRALGINRLSIGVQSFDDATLKRLNRGHAVADALKMYDDARRAGYSNINLDFIYGLPLQTIDDWRTTLGRALALKPEHLSLYALKVEEGTGLEHQIKRGKYPMPEDDLAADMYALAEEMLDVAGYDHYEISNWAKKEVGQWKLEIGHAGGDPTSNFQPLASKHNLTYWLNQPYLGFGAGAHSYFEGSRYWNVLSPLEYIKLIDRGASVVEGREKIGRELEMAETMILGLRLSRGVVFSEFEQRFGEDARVKYATRLRELEELELVQIGRPREIGNSFESSMRLTQRGRLLSNEVFWRFLP